MKEVCNLKRCDVLCWLHFPTIRQQPKKIKRRPVYRNSYFEISSILRQTCFTCHRRIHTSTLPPEHASDKGVSFVRSDCASISALCSKRISTTSLCPAVAAKINGVKPETLKYDRPVYNNVQI